MDINPFETSEVKRKYETMRILFTVSTYKPHKDGIQFVTSYLAEGLAAKGHAVDLIAYEYPDLTDKKEEWINGVYVIRHPAKTVHMMHKGDKEGYRKFILENKSKYDIIINVGLQTAFTDWFLPIMNQIHIPKVLHLHSMWDFKYYESHFSSFQSFATKTFGNLRWGEYFARNKKNFKQYDAVLQLHDKDYSTAFFKKKYNIDSMILENAAEEAFFQISDVEKEKIIINVSNYGKMKNQLDTIKAFERSHVPDDWKLVLIGSKANEYYKQLKEYCETELDPAKRDGVILHVGLSREQVVEYVKKSSIYMTTSRREAFPISILEAMAASVPYISSDVGIVKYLGGGLVAHTPDEFVEYLERLTKDEVFRTSLGEEGRKEAGEKYRVSNKVDQLEDILKSIVSKE